jgi:hypothetical protein
MDFRIKTITYLALFFITTSITAQNNLVFNKVLTFRLLGGQTAEVPAGKTWKIESFSPNSVNNTGYQYFRINKNVTDYGTPMTDNYAVYWRMDYGGSEIVWLQEGSILTGDGNYSEGTKYSIIEFNIEPISSGSDTNTEAIGVSSEGMVFNRVAKTTFTGTFWGEGTNLQTIGSITIPSGKIWKIHNIDTYYFTSTGGNERIERGNLFDTVLIGDNLIKSSSDVTFLSEGTYDVKIKTDGNPINTLVVQAIEYNE